MAIFSNPKLRNLGAMVVGSLYVARYAWKQAQQPQPDQPAEEGLVSIEDIISQIPDDYEFNYSWTLITCKEIPPLGENESTPWAFAIIEPSSQEPVARSGEGFASQEEAVRAGEKVAAFFDRAQAERDNSESAKQIEAGSKRQLAKTPSAQTLQLGGYI